MRLTGAVINPKSDLLKAFTAFYYISDSDPIGDRFPYFDRQMLFEETTQGLQLIKNLAKS